MEQTKSLLKDADMDSVSASAASVRSGSPTDTAKGPTPKGTGRLLSLDALRGFDMFWIIGAGALVSALNRMSDNSVTRFLSTQLTHVQWEGFRFEDLIFPMFVFISGVSLVFSVDKTVAQHGRAKAILRLARRCVVLFLLGLFYYGGLKDRWVDLRPGGVLQYIGLACFFGGSFYVVLRRARAIVIVCGVILIGYWAAMELVPFPDMRLDKKSLAQAEAQAGSKIPSKVLLTATGKVRGYYEEGYNLSNYVDYRYLPGRKINGAYENQPLLGVLGAIATCMLGILAGLWVCRGDISDKWRILGLVAAGVVSVGIGVLWGLQFPIVKKLWSSSFVMVASGLSAGLLALFYWVVEVWGKQRWCQPFVWIGMNSLTIYLAHNIISFSNVAARIAGGDLQRYLDGHVAQGLGSVLLVLVNLGLTFLFARFLYKKKIFIKI